MSLKAKIIGALDRAMGIEPADTAPTSTPAPAVEARDLETTVLAVARDAATRCDTAEQTFASAKRDFENASLDHVDAWGHARNALDVARIRYDAAAAERDRTAKAAQAYLDARAAEQETARIEAEREAATLVRFQNAVAADAEQIASWELQIRDARERIEAAYQASSAHATAAGIAPFAAGHGAALTVHARFLASGSQDWTKHAIELAHVLASGSDWIDAHWTLPTNLDARAFCSALLNAEGPRPVHATLDACPRLPEPECEPRPHVAPKPHDASQFPATAHWLV